MLPERISRARRMLAEVETVADATALRRDAQTLADWARARGLGLAAVNEAIAVALLAELSGAELLAELERARGGDRRSAGHRGRLVSEYARAIADAGLAERTARRWQETWSDVPRELVERLIAEKLQRVAIGDDQAREELTRRWLERAIREERASEMRDVAEVELADADTDAGDTGESIRFGDYRHQLAHLADEVDAVITDPPYERAFLESDAAAELAAHIARWLKPDGNAAIMVGQAWLPRWIELFERALTYRWCICYLTRGRHTRYFHGRTSAGWKPVLLFTRRDADWSQQPWVFDVVRSDGPDKRFHDWGQSVAGAAQLVERLTLPGELVCDPFVGGGTTAIAALELGRRFVGCDIDAGAVTDARRRTLEGAA